MAKAAPSSIVSLSKSNGPSKLLSSSTTSLTFRALASRQLQTNNVVARAFSTAGNSYSSFAEPGSLFTDQPQAGVLAETSLSAPTSGTDRDAQLRADVRAMGSLLGHIIQEHHSKEIFEKIESLRALAKNWREVGAGRKAETAEQADKYFQELADACSTLSNDEMLIISRAFTHFLAIANSAEAHHRVRMLKKSTSFEALPERYDSWCVK